MQQGFVHLDSERPVQNFIDHFFLLVNLAPLIGVHEGFSAFLHFLWVMYNALQSEARTPNGPSLHSDPRNFGRSLVPKVSKICFFSGESSSPTPPTSEPTYLNRVDRSPQTDMRNTCAKMINKELVDAGEQSSTLAESWKLIRRYNAVSRS